MTRINSILNVFSRRTALASIFCLLFVSFALISCGGGGGGGVSSGRNGSGVLLMVCPLGGVRQVAAATTR